MSGGIHNVFLGLELFARVGNYHAPKWECFCLVLLSQIKIHYLCSVFLKLRGQFPFPEHNLCTLVIINRYGYEISVSLKCRKGKLELYCGGGNMMLE